MKQSRDPTGQQVNGDEHLELLEMLYGDTAVPVGNYRPIQSGHSLGVRVSSETATMLKLEDCWKVETAVDLSHNLIAGHALMTEDDDRLLDHI